MQKKEPNTCHVSGNHAATRHDKPHSPFRPCLHKPTTVPFAAQSSPLSLGAASAPEPTHSRRDSCSLCMRTTSTSERIAPSAASMAAVAAVGQPTHQQGQELHSLPVDTDACSPSGLGTEHFVGLNHSTLRSKQQGLTCWSDSSPAATDMTVGEASSLLNINMQQAH